MLNMANFSLPQNNYFRPVDKIEVEMAQKVFCVWKFITKKRRIAQLTIAAFIYYFLYNFFLQDLGPGVKIIIGRRKQSLRD